MLASGGDPFRSWICPFLGDTGCETTAPTTTLPSSSPSMSNPSTTSASSRNDLSFSSEPASSTTSPRTGSPSPATSSSAIPLRPAPSTSPRAPSHSPIPQPRVLPTFNNTFASLSTSKETSSDPTNSPSPASSARPSSTFPLPTPSPTPPPSPSHFNTGAIIGIVIAGIVVNMTVLALLFYVRRRRLWASSTGTGPAVCSGQDRDGGRLETTEDISRQPSDRVLQESGTSAVTSENDDLERTIRSRGSMANRQMNATGGDPAALGDEVARRRGTRCETDGGVRLAGGRPGEAAVDDVDRTSTSESDGSTLPPPYFPQFGAT